MYDIKLPIRIIIITRPHGSRIFRLRCRVASDVMRIIWDLARMRVPVASGYRCEKMLPRRSLIIYYSPQSLRRPGQSRGV